MGEIEREKARAAIQGHRGNMQKGVHFFETFAATPQEESIRILAILTIKLNLSSEHNEYMAITNIAKKLVWLRQLLAELGLPILLPT